DGIILLSEELMQWEQENENNLSNWCTKLHHQATNLRDDLSQQIPWLDILPVPGHFIQLVLLDYNLSLSSIRDISDELLENINHYEQQENNTEHMEWLNKMQTYVENGRDSAISKITLSKQLAEQCEQLSIVEYDFLF